MNKLIKITFFAFAVLSSTFAIGQTKLTAKSLNLVVSGTSTLHDWEMKSGEGSFEAIFTQNAGGAITAVSGLSFSTPAESLKSGKGAMDKNAYKALKTSKHTAISFAAASTSVTAQSATDFVVKANGKLTMAGKTLNTEVVAICKVNADKTISIVGAKKLDMKEYEVDPPSFMMGTIKTGKDVTLKFDLRLK